MKVLPAGGLTLGLDGAKMSEIGLIKEAGAVFFTNGDKPVEDAGVLRRAMTYAASFDALVASRPDTPALSKNTVMNAGAFAARLGLRGTPPEAEWIALERDLMLAETTGVRLLADCISTGRSLEAVEQARANGVKVSCSVAAYSLFFNELDVGDYLTYCKVQPPFRKEEDRMALIDGLKRGAIDAVVSAHDPQPTEDKRLPIADAAFGAVGLETLLTGPAQPRPARRDPARRRAEARHLRPRRPARPAAGPPRQGRAGRPRPVRPRRALGLRPRRPHLALQELALRWPQARRPRVAHMGEWRDRVRAGIGDGDDAATDVEIVLCIGFAIFGYLLGSIPFGLVLTKLAGLGDIRTIGSGNIGATNVLRTGRKDLALATLLLDAGKIRKGSSDGSAGNHKSTEEILNQSPQEDSFNRPKRKDRPYRVQFEIPEEGESMIESPRYNGTAPD